MRYLDTSISIPFCPALSAGRNRPSIAFAARSFRLAQISSFLHPSRYSLTFSPSPCINASSPPPPRTDASSPRVVRPATFLARLQRGSADGRSRPAELQSDGRLPGRAAAARLRRLLTGGAGDAHEHVGADPAPRSGRGLYPAQRAQRWVHSVHLTTILDL